MSRQTMRGSPGTSSGRRIRASPHRLIEKALPWLPGRTSNPSRPAFALEQRVTPPARRCARSVRAPHTPPGRRREADGTPWRRSWPPTRDACLTCSRFATGAWCARRSPSTGARRSRWRPTSPPRRRAGFASSAAGMRTCRTSAGSPRRNARSCSRSTISTRRCRRPGSGTSSDSPRASSRRVVTSGCRTPSRRTSRRPASAPTASRWTSSAS